MKHAVRSAGTLLLMGTLMMGTGFAVCAEEEVVEPAGYHVYENTDDYPGNLKGILLCQRTESGSDRGCS